MLKRNCSVELHEGKEVVDNRCANGDLGGEWCEMVCGERKKQIIRAMRVPKEQKNIE